jgi:hypothetical protein
LAAGGVGELVKKARQRRFAFEPIGKEERSFDEQLHELRQKRREMERARYFRILTKLGMSAQETSEMSVETMQSLVINFAAVAQDSSDDDDVFRYLYAHESADTKERQIEEQIDELSRRKYRVAHARLDKDLAKGSNAQVVFEPA